MKNYLYLIMALLVAFVSCEKDNLEINALEATEVGDKSTKIDLAAKKQSFTVIGQDNPAVDIPAVQDAVDNNDYVTLEGVFDFGTDELTGGIDITREGVIVQGPATILNGAKAQIIPGLGLIKYPISIGAPGVEIHQIEFSCDYDGILVYVQEDGKPVIIQGNTVISNIFGGGVAAAATPGGIKVLNNAIESFWNYYGAATTGHTVIANNDMVAGLDGVFMFTFNNKLDILNNNMTIIDGWDGVFIGSWRATTETGPEWGDNPPVRIIGNTIQVEGMDAAGIVVGTSATGINNVMVRDNTITGTVGFSGLMKQPYGHNNKFINNDLSKLTTYGPQIWTLGGRDNHYQNNRLGNVLPISGGGFLPNIRDAATLVSTLNGHEFDFLNTPDPVNHGNHFSNNDYTNTGLPGWSDDPESIGAILLLDFIQRFDATGNPYEEPFEMENFIAEKTFPAGTDVCNQVLDLNPGANHIAGWQACETQAKKATYELAKAKYKNLGQVARERHLRREKVIENMKKLKE